jgi:hypothetical protein
LLVVVEQEILEAQVVAQVDYAQQLPQQAVAEL